jgi:hypothetical protein
MFLTNLAVLIDLIDFFNKFNRFNGFNKSLTFRMGFLLERGGYFHNWHAGGGVFVFCVLPDRAHRGWCLWVRPGPFLPLSLPVWGILPPMRPW